MAIFSAADTQNRCRRRARNTIRWWSIQQAQQKQQQQHCLTEHQLSRLQIPLQDIYAMNGSGPGTKSVIY